MLMSHYTVLIQHYRQSYNTYNHKFNGLGREKLNAWSRNQSGLGGGCLVHVYSKCCVIIGLKLFY